MHEGSINFPPDTGRIQLSPDVKVTNVKGMVLLPFISDYPVTRWLTRLIVAVSGDLPLPGAKKPYYFT
jgi:hypothetical protein